MLRIPMFSRNIQNMQLIVWTWEGTSKIGMIEKIWKIIIHSQKGPRCGVISYKWHYKWLTRIIYFTQNSVELFHPTYNWWAHFTHPLLDPMADLFSNLLVPSPPKKGWTWKFIKITINVQDLIWWKKMPISEIPPNYQPNKNYAFSTTVQGISPNPTTSDSKLEKLSTFLEVWESYLPLRAMRRSREFLFNPKFRVTITCLDRLEYNQS